MQDGQVRTDKIVSFTLGRQRFALMLAAVEKIYPLAEITPLPKAPDIVIGVVNVQGRIIPVVDIRKRFRILPGEPELSNRLLIARTSHRPVALVVDDVVGVLSIGADEVINSRTLLPETGYIAGVVKREDGLILIHDLDTFLSLEEEEQLVEALQEAQ